MLEDTPTIATSSAQRIAPSLGSHLRVAKPHRVFATFCAFMLGAARTTAPSSAHRIAPSPACHPSVAIAHNVFATSWGFMLEDTRVTVVKRVCTRRSSMPVPLAQSRRTFASRLQAVAAFTALNSPCSARTIARMSSKLRAEVILLFS